MEELGKMATVAYMKRNLNNKHKLYKEKLWLGSVGVKSFTRLKKSRTQTKELEVI